MIPEPADEAHTRIFGTDSSPIHAPLSLLPLPHPFFGNLYSLRIFGNIFETKTLKVKRKLIYVLLDRYDKQKYGVSKSGRFEYSVLSLFLGLKGCNVPKMDASYKVYFDFGKFGELGFRVRVLPYLSICLFVDLMILTFFTPVLDDESSFRLRSSPF